MKHLALNLAALTIIVGAHASGAIVYSNTTTDTGTTIAYAANGYTQIGDQIKLAGTERLATLATVQFFNNGLAGTFDATLRLFNVGAPVGTQIGSDFVVTGVAAPAGNVNPNDGVFNLAFLLPSILVPNDLIFTVAIANSSAGVDIIGLNLFEPPTIPAVNGSDNTFAIAHNGTMFITTGTSDANVYFELQADAQPTGVPEPATTGIAMLFLIGGGIFRYRARR